MVVSEGDLLAWVLVVAQGRGAAAVGEAAPRLERTYDGLAAHGTRFSAGLTCHLSILFTDIGADSVLLRKDCVLQSQTLLLLFCPPPFSVVCCLFFVSRF